MAHRMLPKVSGTENFRSPLRSSFNFVFQLGDCTPAGAGFGTSFNEQARIKCEVRMYLRLAKPKQIFGQLQGDIPFTQEVDWEMIAKTAHDLADGVEKRSESLVSREAAARKRYNIL